MFIGHYGVAFGVKKVAPQLSLGLLFMAVQFQDLLWPLLLLLNIEHAEIASSSNPVPLLFTDFPISHSLVSNLLWSTAFGGIYFIFKRDVKGSLVLFFAVLSHWLLDFIVHYPDLPITLGASEKVGLGLWQSTLLTAVVESAIFLYGAYTYEINTYYNNGKGKYLLPLCILLLIVIHTTSVLGPRPDNIKAVAIAANFQWIFVGLGLWIDKHRFLKNQR